MDPRFQEETTLLVIKHRKAVMAYIFAIVRDHHLTEDIFQEVSILAIREWEKAGGQGSFFALAREISKRHSLAVLRREQKQPPPLAPETLNALDRSFEAISEEVDVQRTALIDCVNQLTVEWREIIRLRYWDYLEVKNIAERMKKSPSTVSVTLNRIRSKLADCVRRKQEGPAQ